MVVRTQEHSYASLGEIAQVFRELRKEKGLTQQQVADQLGVKRAYIGKVEKGVDKISLNQANKLLKIFDKKVVLQIANL